MLLFIQSHSSIIILLTIEPNLKLKLDSHLRLNYILSSALFKFSKLESQFIIFHIYFPQFLTEQSTFLPNLFETFYKSLKRSNRHLFITLKSLCFVGDEKILFFQIKKHEHISQIGIQYLNVTFKQMEVILDFYKNRWKLTLQKKFVSQSYLASRIVLKSDNWLNRWTLVYNMYLIVF